MHAADRLIGHTLRGRITRISSEDGWGFVLTEDGYELYFEARALEGTAMTELTRDSWVEFEFVRYGPGYAVIVARLWLERRR